MSERYITGQVRYLTGEEIEKCEHCNGRGYHELEGHPECPNCSGNGYVKISRGS